LDNNNETSENVCRASINQMQKLSDNESYNFMGRLQARNSAYQLGRLHARNSAYQPHARNSTYQSQNGPGLNKNQIVFNTMDLRLNTQVKERRGVMETDNSPRKSVYADSRSVKKMVFDFHSS
jgi:hypothetical protein